MRRVLQEACNQIALASICPQVAAYDLTGARVNEASVILKRSYSRAALSAIAFYALVVSAIMLRLAFGLQTVIARQTGLGWMILLCSFGIIALTASLAWQPPVVAEQPGHVTGIGGVFVKSKDPKALARWYKEVLGLDVASWGGAALPFDAPGHPPKVSWMAFSTTTDHMMPSSREFMINFTVDDMDAMIARLTARGVPILKRDDADAFGRFAWIQDPDGTKIELWQPK